MNDTGSFSDREDDKSGKLSWVSTFRDNFTDIVSYIRHFFHLEYHYMILRRNRKHRYYIQDFSQKALSVVVVSVVRFFNDAGVISASALTYYSILSIIPIIAIVFALAKGFGVYQNLETVLHSYFDANSEVLDQMILYANHTVENAKGGVITGIGIFLLLWAVIRVLNSMEITMNQIWRVRRGRSLRRLFTDYASIIFIAPILVILGSSLNVFLMTNLETYLPTFAPWVMQLFKFLPYVLVWVLFIFIYMFMPTAPVRFKHAFWAGMIAGTLFQVVQWFYIRFQVGVSSYNAIYGGLAALPLLLVWLQLSWSIVLWGTELCYIIRNRHFMYKNELHGDEPWLLMIEESIKIVTYIANNYFNLKNRVKVSAIAKHFRMNISKVQLIMEELTERNIVTFVREKHECYYFPAFDIHQTTVADIIINLSQVDESRDRVWKERFTTAIRSEFSNARLVAGTEEPPCHDTRVNHD